ncbi:hypothetical protein LRP49_16290 [Enterovibrio sp. ZSDZ35]|uniref:ABM domain-containing protein n=1 Tax=Enterovibrio qingdaonensis TaxID=2899818 RepID=A0ABT5QPX3_9GAMM|nr:hypothetical protein [Enterovibrio sp. ZSDZ35]MDD1782733.1 hypothetical protein [Enterovibrio sp. ZSDZ35]
MENIVETVRFKLKEDANEAQFLADSEATVSFVTQSAGFLYRSLSVDESSQTWTDITYWDSMENAKAAYDDFMNHESARNMISHIEEESVVMSHETLKMNVMSDCAQSA